MVRAGRKRAAEWYNGGMTELLQDAVEALRHWPEEVQDQAARALLELLALELEPPQDVSM